MKFHGQCLLFYWAVRKTKIGHFIALYNMKMYIMNKNIPVNAVKKYGYLHNLFTNTKANVILWLQ